jgi:hypothetical protein
MKIQEIGVNEKIKPEFHSESKKKFDFHFNSIFSNTEMKIHAKVLTKTVLN